MMCELFSEALTNNFSKADNELQLTICDPIWRIDSENLNISIDEPVVLKALL